MTPAVQTTDLTKVYGEGETAVHALQDVGITIPRGEFVVILGPSGSGKTTLLNQVGALEEPTSGSIVADGVELAGLDAKGRTDHRLNAVGFVFQFYNLVPTLTAHENVALIAELTGGDADQRAAEVLAKVGLADRSDHFPAQLSGGEQQRVSIARGLVKNPPLMLCDEPTGALDIDMGIQILELLRDVTKEDGRTVLTVTHNSVIAQMADRVLRLIDGEIVDETVNPNPAQPSDLTW